MQSNQREIQARFLKGFGDKSRLLILENLTEGEKTVSELVKATGLSQSNTSMHLACMLTCGIVEKTQHGRQAIYKIASNDVKELLFLMRRIVSKICQDNSRLQHPELS